MTFWTKSSRYFQCRLEIEGERDRERTDFRKVKTNKQNTFKMFKEKVKRKDE